MRRRVQGSCGTRTWVRVQATATAATIAKQSNSSHSLSTHAALPGCMAASTNSGSGQGAAGGNSNTFNPNPISPIGDGLGSVVESGDAARSGCEHSWAARTQIACRAATAVLASAQINVRALAAAPPESLGVSSTAETSAAAGLGPAATEAAAACAGQLPASHRMQADAAALRALCGETQTAFARVGLADVGAAPTAGSPSPASASALSPEMAMRISELLAGDDPRSDAAAEHKVAAEVRARYSAKVRHS